MTAAAQHAFEQTTEPYAAPAADRPGLFRRWFAAIEAAQMRRAEREVAMHLGLNGGRMTDEIERRIAAHFLRNTSFRP